MWSLEVVGLGLESSTGDTTQSSAALKVKTVGLSVMLFIHKAGIIIEHERRHAYWMRSWEENLESFQSLTSECQPHTSPPGIQHTMVDSERMYFEMKIEELDVGDVLLRCL